MTVKYKHHNLGITYQYAPTVPIRYYGYLPHTTKVSGGHVMGTLGTKRADPGLWREMPHEVLANVPTYDTATIPQVLTTKPVRGLADPKAIEMFVKKYGILVGYIGGPTERFDEDAAHFADAQHLLRRAWTGDRAALKELLVQVKTALEPRASIRADKVEVTTENLWSFVCLSFLIDYREGTTKVCARADCSHPYFLEKRKGQRYCSQKCAVVMNVRRFRERKGSQRKRSKL